MECNLEVIDEETEAQKYDPVVTMAELAVETRSFESRAIDERGNIKWIEQQWSKNKSIFVIGQNIDLN